MAAAEAMPADCRKDLRDVGDGDFDCERMAVSYCIQGPFMKGRRDRMEAARLISSTIMHYKPLGNTGLSLSTLSFGASPLGNEFGETDAAEGLRAVHAALELGINCFDTSPYYGRTLSEARLGEALEQAGVTTGSRRAEIVLSTKCGRYDTAGFNFSAARVKRSVDESLARLRTGYVDLLFAHDVEFGDPRQIVEETIPALREIQRSGKARFIGISGFPLGVLKAIAESATVDAILSYCHYNLLMDDLDSDLAPFCEAGGIGLLNASPLHMRVLSEVGPPEWHPAPAEVKAAARAVLATCQRYGARIEDVALQFCAAYRGAATTIVGLAERAHVEANVAALSHTADPALLAEIAAVVAPVKNRAWHTGHNVVEDGVFETGESG